jgi:hypothetical protein
MKKTGRPPLAAGTTSEPVCFRLPSPAFDALAAHAARQRKSVSDVVRDAVLSVIRSGEAPTSSAHSNAHR